ncbi:hypothetical protein VOLCADRAFT_57522 [Volvox carteri f. nagariensis]|uniref:Uncharacterized protein n=1 Tax=Volvox carteri f. nagariensis TaxID=3068 RepID=D8TNF7_VOLCA|nr:uncharacterized protein VOLCADRAFT_57522 [Volvox carteri f. nagariensis]EFJ50984.1 hypothetical protein VOLCADRAFT_57522 [Volvox carteri f. nagariensis]|eukprot:XP_002947996.1 hypothetical protein VOLCADRAFT_57522 [Volvox carteri f. nagariensis]
MGKLSCSPRHSSTHVGRHPHNLIHMDVSGPMPDASVGGTRCFTALYDDFSKFFELCCIAVKGEVPGTVHKVSQQWERQTGVEVHFLYL